MFASEIKGQQQAIVVSNESILGLGRPFGNEDTAAKSVGGVAGTVTACTQFRQHVHAGAHSRALTQQSPGFYVTPPQSTQK